MAGLADLCFGCLGSNSAAEVRVAIDHSMGDGHSPTRQLSYVEEAPHGRGRIDRGVGFDALASDLEGQLARLCEWISFHVLSFLSVYADHIGAVATPATQDLIDRFRENFSFFHISSAANREMMELR
jgi:hypothetical protein